MKNFMYKVFGFFVVIFITTFLAGCFYFEVIDDEIGSEPITIEDAISLYGGDYAFTWDDDGNNIIFPYDDSDTLVCIDSNLSEDLITAAIAAVEEFDSLDFISLTYYMSDEDGCSFITEVEDGFTYELYDDLIVYTSYRDDVVYHDNDEDWCSADDSDVYGCNLYWWDWDDEFNSSIILNSAIYFNLNLLETEDYDVLEHVALHELGHAFGLDDLYRDELGEHSIMYNNSDYMSKDFTEYDLFNLEYVYHIFDTDEEK